MLGMDMSADERRRQIWHLYAAEGWKPRKIAREVGLSRSQVYRIIAEGPPEPPDDDGLEDDLRAMMAADAAANPIPVMAGPFVFTGMALTDADIPGVDPGRAVLVEQFLSADGEPATMLDVWRSDYTDGSVDKGYCDNAFAQIEAAGYRQADNGDGTWRWVASTSV